jgi:DHA3 family macrolide efflux protein-like MFS transporter
MGGAFQQPAMTSSTSLMVPDKHLARIAGANQTLQGVINIVAPPLGALLLELYSTQAVLMIDIATAALAILPLLFIRIPQPARQLQSDGSLQNTSYLQDLRQGFAYVVHWKGLLGLILLAMALNFLLIPVSSLMPLVITKIFHGDASQQGWVESMSGLGLIIGGIMLSIWGGFKRRIITSLSGVIGIGLGVVSAGLVPRDMFYLLFISTFLMGFSTVFANGPLMAIMQSTVAPEMQGRVFSLLTAGASAMMPLSLLIAGPISDRFGIRFWYLMGGSVCILMTIAITFNSAIMKIEENHVDRQSMPDASIPE